MGLAALLDEGARFDAEYRGGLSSHLPMALTALHRLGADDARLQSFAQRYAKRLSRARAPQPWPAGDAWRGRFGERAAWPAYRSLFREWLAVEGAAPVLSQALPALMPGCGAAAFHGLIRVAYAVQAGHAGELADGLAYWACRFLPLGDLTDAAGREADPEVLLRGLPAGQSTANLIFERMRDAAGTAALRTAVPLLAVGPATLELLAHLAAQAYADSGNFTALHLVTSCHAVRVLTPFFDDDPAPAWRWYWQAFAAAVMAAGLKPRPRVPALPWPRIVEAAIASDDDHVIKLVDSCREQARAYSGPIWRAAAARAID